MELSRWQDGATVAATGYQRNEFPAPDEAAERIEGHFPCPLPGHKNICYQSPGAALTLAARLMSHNPPG
jgi:hypothetical protein